MPDEFEKLKAQLESEGLGAEATTVAAISQQAAFSAAYILTLRSAGVDDYDALELTKHWMILCCPPEGDD